MNPKRSITLLMDGNFLRLDQRVVSPHMAHRKFAARFIQDFAHVRIAARSFPVQNAHGDLVTGERTEFIDLGGHRGVKSLAMHLPRLLWRIWRVVRKSDVLLLRFPGNLSLIAMLMCRLTGKAFSTEVVADPADYFSESASRHPLRKMARAVDCWATRSAAKHGRTARYVTTEALQASYPPREPSHSFGFSDVYLPDRILIGDHSHASSSDEPSDHVFSIVNVAMMHNESKGHSHLLYAVAALRGRGMNICLTLVGDGVLRPDLEKLSARLGLGDCVRFTGALDGESVLRTVKAHSLFALPSLQEGMPRALLEAMSLGAAVVASRVGGVAEVLEPVSLVPPADSAALGERISYFALNAQFRADQKRRNRKTARRFRFSELQKRYRHYCEALKAHG